jgi:hypothetical protein
VGAAREGLEQQGQVESAPEEQQELPPPTSRRTARTARARRGINR